MADDVLVLYGACDASVRTPYGPFVTALEHLERVTDPDVLRSDLGPAGGEVRRLLPDLPQRVGELPDPVPGDPDSERHRLHTAVAHLLASVGRRHPVLLVVEDVHWADGPTLLLLRHLARSAADARMLLLATFRDTQADMPSELSQALVDLRRAEDVVRLGPNGSERGRGRRVRAPDRRRRARPRAQGACVDDQRADGRQRVSHDGAMAHLDGDGCAGDRERDGKARPSVGGAQKPGERPRRRERSTLTARPCYSRGPRDRCCCGIRVRARGRPTRVELDERGLLAALDEAVGNGMIETASGHGADLPLHPRTRAPRTLRSVERSPSRRAAPAGGDGPRGRPSSNSRPEPG